MQSFLPTKAFLLPYCSSGHIHQKLLPRSRFTCLTKLTDCKLISIKNINMSSHLR
ncbi:unnamed protein product [Ixodes persulcatus]